MKRVDFDPNGERNPQNRGKSRYERISWDEALELVAGELKRVKETYGGSAISGITSSHHNWGIVGYKMGPFARFMNMHGVHPGARQPGQLGRLALGRHAYLRLLLAPGHARALRHAVATRCRTRR